MPDPMGAEQDPGRVRGSAVGGLKSVLFLDRLVASVVAQPMSGVLGSRGLYLGGGMLLLLLALLFSAAPIVLRRVTRRESLWVNDGNVPARAERLLGLFCVSDQGSPPRKPSVGACVEPSQLDSCSPA